MKKPHMIEYQVQACAPRPATLVAERLARKTQRPMGGAARSRRRFLVSSGALLALPALELFRSEEALSQAGTPPRRLVIYYLPNGRVPEYWVPSATGENFTLPQASASLTPFKDQLVFFSGLRNDAQFDTDPGAGNHGRANAGISSCVPIDNMLSLDHPLLSVDQQLVQTLQPDTRIRSLQYTAGEPYSCDRGTACAYTQTMSWAGPNQPLTAMADPLIAFNQLFGGAEGDTPEAQQIRRASLRSILDYTLVEASSFAQSLGAEDKAKFEEYREAVRDLERRVLQTNDACDSGPAPAAGLEYMPRVDAFHDLMSLAMQCDQSRYITFMIEYGLSSRSHPEIGAPGGHHANSHYGTDQNKYQELITVETWQGDQIGKFVQKIADNTEADGSSMLDNTLVMVLPEMGNGDAHDHANLAPIFVGKAGGALLGGQHQNLPGRPLADAYVTLMQAFGVQANFGAYGRNVISGVLA